MQAAGYIEAVPVPQITEQGRCADHPILYRLQADTWTELADNALGETSASPTRAELGSQPIVEYSRSPGSLPSSD